ncbi:MAG: trypsin-like peptidase domain-containing protein [Planctomycetaceae bacterium]|nr:trypsin-like peptidase domain-containing protein [Planctomycetaceae bacterium]
MKHLLKLPICLFLLIPALQADQATLEFRQAALKASMKKVIPALVSVNDGYGAGSGVVVSEDGLVLTASHVVESGRRRRPQIRVVFPDGSIYPARVLGMNRTADAAMLKITRPYRENDGKFPFVELGESKNLERGEWCFALGHPGGFSMKRPAPLRLGRILSVGYRTVVSDCAIVLGDSGGPLFDLSGKLIGIHSMITEVIVENRHVAIDVFRRDGDRMESGESWGELRSRDNELVSSQFFGVGIRWSSFEPEVDFVGQGTPAWRAGLRPGDRLNAINGQRFADGLGLSTLLSELDAEQAVEVSYIRAGRDRTTTVTTGQIPTEEELDNVRETLPRNREQFREMRNRLTALRKVGNYEKRSSSEMQNFDSVVAGSGDSVVQLRAFGETLALGTIVSSDGYILTKASELENTIDPDCVMPDGRRLKIEEIATDRSFDLMLLKVKAKGLTPVEWSTEPPPPVGTILVTTDSRGTPILPGVVSVANRKLPTSQRGFLGVELRQEGENVAVQTVLPTGAAERAGLLRDDIILTINDVTIRSVQQMIVTVGRIPPNGEVTIRYRRGNTVRTVETILTPRFVSDSSDVMLDRYRETENLGKYASAHNSGFPEVIQHDTDLFPNQCGGPVFDISGKAIGLNISRSARIVSYAIPAHAVQSVLAELKKKARADN